MADPSDYSSHENQLILAKRLIERGAKVKAVTRPQGATPLCNACHGGNVTNLDFVELLLKAGGCRSKFPGPSGSDTIDVYRHGGSRCGQMFH
jgi:ankyrin repeat protein